MSVEAHTCRKLLQDSRHIGTANVTIAGEIPDGRFGAVTLVNGQYVWILAWRHELDLTKPGPDYAMIWKAIELAGPAVEGMAIAMDRRQRAPFERDRAMERSCEKRSSESGGKRPSAGAPNLRTAPANRILHNNICPTCGTSFELAKCVSRNE